jgi:hypothetical protein
MPPEAVIPYVPVVVFIGYIEIHIGVVIGDIPIKITTVLVWTGTALIASERIIAPVMLQ